MNDALIELPRITGIEEQTISGQDFFNDIAEQAAAREGSVILLSGGESDSAKYNILAAEPILTIRSKEDKTDLTFEDSCTSLKEDSLEILKYVTAFYQKVWDDLPGTEDLPVISGLFGYLSYDLKNRIETIKPQTIDDLNLPDIYMILPGLVVVQEIITGDIRAFRIRAETTDAENADSILSRQPEITNGNFSITNAGFRSSFEKGEYKHALSEVINYIKEGDIYQVNISQRFTADFKGNSYTLFKELFKENPAAFFAYIHCGDHQIVSTSPERFILKEGTRVEARPIKGTRPRGATIEEDIKLKEELASSAKDDAELSMIVDLLRNDIGKVCKGGSVRVVKHKALESYKNVHHLVSTIEGCLDEHKDSIDLIRATFPGGSITGCPKIRSMEIIEEIEPFKRHIYTGSIGYIGFNGRMDLSIAIRTATVTGGKILFSAGGGIVYDSDPEDEYYETLHKGRSLMKVLEKHKTEAFVPILWHNGKFTTVERALVPSLSPGHRYGQGVFETIKVENGRKEYLDEHLERLESGYRAVTDSNLPELDWEGIADQLVLKNRLSDKTAVLRILISKGGQGLFDSCDITVTCSEYQQRKALKRDGCLKLGIYPNKRESFLADYKSMNYLFYLEAGQWAAENGFDEAVILNADGTVSETNTGNILIEQKQTVIIPESKHRLRGVMEKVSLERYRGKGFYVVTRPVSVQELSAFIKDRTSKVYITNSLIGKVRGC